MKQYRVAGAARTDLDEIWFYIAQDNVDAADKFIHAIVSRFPKLAAMPQLGRRREELAPRLRSFPVGRYVIFYRPMEELKLRACCTERGISRRCSNEAAWCWTSPASRRARLSGSETCQIRSAYHLIRRNHRGFKTLPNNAPAPNPSAAR